MPKIETINDRKQDKHRERKSKSGHSGIKSQRSSPNRTLLEPCENCKCKRYNPCRCMKPIDT